MKQFKRIALVLMIFLGIVFLTSCDGLLGNQKEELELTNEERFSLFEEIDYGKVTDSVVSIKGSIDLDLNVKMEQEEAEENFELPFELRGSVELYASLKSYEEMFVYLNIEGSLDGDLSMITMAGLPKMSIDAKVYITNGNVYVDGTVVQGGTTVTVQNKYLDVFDEDDYDELVAGLEIDFSDFEIDFEEIPEELKIKTYKVGDSYEFEMVVDTDVLDDLISEIEELLFGAFGEEASFVVNKNEDFLTKVTIKFSDRLEKITLNSKIDLELKSEFEDEEAAEDNASLTINLFNDLKLTIDFKDKMPSGLPSLAQLEEFEEAEDDFDLEF